MPPEFRKIKARQCINHFFKHHTQKVEEGMETLDGAGIRLKQGKCKITLKEKKKLGFKLTASGLTPTEDKVQAKTGKLKPKNLNNLRSVMGAVNQMNSFMASLAQIPRLCDHC